MTEQLFKEITTWQKETFGQATPISKLSHLSDEVLELKSELNEGQTGFISPEQDEKIKLEYADCFFLLFGSAAAYGMSFDDIVKCIQDKFEINKKRKWGKPDNNGVVNHIKD